METKTSKGKEIKIPGPDHPITISPAEGMVRVTVAGKIVAESIRALRLEEKGYPPVYYLPRSDADMSLLVRTTHYTYCPYKGDCTYYSIPIGGTKSEYAAFPSIGGRSSETRPCANSASRSEAVACPHTSD